MAITATTFAQGTPHNILRKYKNNDGVMSLKFEGDVLDLINRKDGEELKSKLDYMDIIVFKEGSDLSDSDRTALKQSLSNDNFEMLINAKDGKNKVKIMGLDTGDNLSHVFVNANTEKANIYVVIKGELFFEELKDLNLEKVDNIFD